MSTIRTVYEFVLPRGYVDAEGGVHRDGLMRLATAADEILPLRDPRVQANQLSDGHPAFARDHPIGRRRIDQSQGD